MFPFFLRIDNKENTRRFDYWAHLLCIEQKHTLFTQTKKDGYFIKMKDYNDYRSNKILVNQIHPYLIFRFLEFGCY